MRASTPASETQGRPPLERVRRFFELTQQHYRKEGYMGCLLGGLGQELSGVSEVFRRKIEGCFSEIAERIAVCLEEARKRGDIPADSDPRRMASLLVDCWEGAALRSRLRRECRAADRDARLLLPVGSQSLKCFLTETNDLRRQGG